MTFKEMIKKQKLTKTKAVVLTVLLALSFFILPKTVVADSYQEQINALNAQIAQDQGRLGNISQQKNTLENKVTAINAEISQLNATIQKTQLEISQVKQQLKETEERLEKQKRIMQENARTLYKTGELSTIEILASSDNFSEFINKQEYLERVKESVNKAAKEVMELQDDLEKKETQLNDFVAKQELQKQVQQAKRHEQQTLLEETRGEESRYQAVVAQKRGQRDQLVREQAAAMAAAAAARAATRSGGGPDYSGYSEYPFPNASMNYDDGCRYSDGSSAADDWGYCKRQCTSYVAWKLMKDGKSGFSYLGHAINWRTDNKSFRSAQRGDVVVWDIGGYGHVMYVEAATDSGLSISQFNVPYDSGQYSTDFYTYDELRNGVAGAGFSLRRF